MGSKGFWDSEDYSIKIAAVLVLAVIFAAAIVIAEKKAREPQPIFAKAKSLVLEPEDLEKGFEVSESGKEYYKNSDAWANWFSAEDGNITTQVYSTVYVYPTIKDAEEEYAAYLYSILKREGQQEIPFKSFGDKSLFYSKFIEREEGMFPWFELSFRKSNIIAYAEIIVEDPGFDNDARVFEAIARYSEIMEQKIFSQETPAS